MVSSQTSILVYGRYSGSFPLAKQSVHEVDHSSPSSVEVKNLSTRSSPLPIYHHGSYNLKAYLVNFANIPMLIIFIKVNVPVVFYVHGSVHRKSILNL